MEEILSLSLALGDSAMVTHCIPLVVETLSRLVDKAAEVGILKGFLISNSQSQSILILPSLFADDTFFCKPEESNLGYLRCILLLFEVLFLLVRCQTFIIHQLAQFFGFGVECLASSYLDLPLGASFKCKTMWEPIVERFHKRLTLLQSTLWGPL